MAGYIAPSVWVVYVLREIFVGCEVTFARILGRINVVENSIHPFLSRFLSGIVCLPGRDTAIARKAAALVGIVRL